MLLLFGMLLIPAACSSSNQDSSNKDADYGANEFAQESYDNDSDMAYEESGEASEKEEAVSDIDTTNISNRMIIHQAQLSVKVKDIENTQLKIEEKVNKYSGYIVESNVYQGDNEHVHGHITVRIPEKHFNNFLSDVENEVADTLERTITGEDVTEQYIDLESRVKSKRVVEERLLELMKEAKKTEDLLSISNNLATVQEEIEVIVGKMNFLKNKSDYATIEIYMQENKVIVPELDSKKLDTWERTKKQLATSINFLLTAGSGFIVFFIGNLPIFIIILVIGSIIYLTFRKKTKEK